MTWFVIGGVAGVVLAFTGLHVWATTGERRQLLVRLRAEERLREIQLAGLQGLVSAGEQSLASTQLGFTDADIAEYTKPAHPTTALDLGRSSWQQVQPRERT